MKSEKLEIVKNETIHSLFRGMVMSLLFTVWVVASFAQKPAGTTFDRATRVADTTLLSVQSGGNFVRVDTNHLPAVFIYMPDTAFGPMPQAMVMEEVLEPQVFFTDCRMGWKWFVEESDEPKIVEIKAHEDASLRVEPTIRYTFNQVHEAACDSFILGDKVLKTSGEYFLDTTIMENGDRFVNSVVLALTYSSSFEQTIKEYTPFISATGKEYAETGNYLDTIANTAGCDSVILTRFTRLTTAYDTIRPNECDSFVYNGKAYKQSIKFNDTILDEVGNRVIMTVELTIRHPSSFEQTIKDYKPFISATGKEYTQSGTYKDTITNAAGCDSVILTNFTFLATTYDTLRAKVCDNYSYKGKNYTESIKFNDTILDAIGNRQIKTLELTINHSSSGELVIAQYDSYTSDQGNLYTKSGTYVESLTNTAGCDSTLTLRITILVDNTTYDTVYYCRGFNMEHEEKVTEDLIRRYRPYAFESPATVWPDIMEKAKIAGELDGMTVDLNGAEKALYAYYVEPLMPIETIAWSIRYKGETKYTPIQVENAPQWLKAGTLAVQIRFRCGEIYCNELPLAVESVGAADQAPVKCIKNGQVIIIRGDAAYTPLGQKIY